MVTLSWAKDVTLKLAALGFVVSLAAMTGACGWRVTPARVPLPPQAIPPIEAPSTLPNTPEPPPPTAPAARPEVDPGDCELITDPGKPIATVALAERIDPSNAPHPSNESERVLFRQLYETLIRVDCKGQVRPALASSWRLDANGRTWIVTLRESAQFSDGTPVTPSAVRAGWSRDGAGDELRPRVSRLVESIVAIDDRALAITLRSPRVDAPLALAHSDLAIAKPADGSRWPLGTRSGRVGARAGDSGIILERDDLPSIEFRVTPGDPRDVLDRGVDLLLTRDRGSIDYAATLPQFQSVPLEWHRTHVLLTPGRAHPSSSLSEDSRRALANDAIRGEAQSAVGPFWWQMLRDCGVVLFQPPAQAALAPRIVYDGADAAARDLAERLVGLRMYQRATGLTGEPLAAARRRGRDAGYIMSFDRRPLDPCREIQVVMDAVGWLDPETIVPLVDTRLQAIVRRGHSGITVEWDGGLLIAGASGR